MPHSLVWQPLKTTVATKMIFPCVLPALLGHAGHFTWALKVPGISGWAGSKQEALLLCLLQFIRETMKILLIPDSLQDFGPAQMNLLCMQSTVLFCQWESPSGNQTPHLLSTPEQYLLAIEVLLQWPSRKRDPATEKLHATTRIFTTMCPVVSQVTPKLSKVQRLLKGNGKIQCGRPRLSLEKPQHIWTVILWTEMSLF